MAEDLRGYQNPGLGTADGTAWQVLQLLGTAEIVADRGDQLGAAANLSKALDLYHSLTPDETVTVTRPDGSRLYGVPGDCLGPYIASAQDYVASQAPKADELAATASAQDAAGTNAILAASDPDTVAAQLADNARVAAALRIQAQGGDGAAAYEDAVVQDTVSGAVGKVIKGGAAALEQVGGGVFAGVVANLPWWGWAIGAAVAGAAGFVVYRQAKAVIA